MLMGLGQCDGRLMLSQMKSVSLGPWYFVIHVGIQGAGNLQIRL